MRVLELFCGTKSVGKVCEKHGMEVVSVDICNKWNPTYCMDVLDITDSFLDSLGHFDMIWASPDCRHYSKIRRNWKALGHRPPDIEYANRVVQKTLYIIEYLRPRHWFIENPATGLLKQQSFMQNLPMKTCCYCRYDASYPKKETAIWSSSLSTWQPLMCSKVTGQCKIKAETGKHKTVIGSSGLPEVSRVDRIRIPHLLIESILQSAGIVF